MTGPNAADLLDLAAARVTEYGWTPGPDWYDTRAEWLIDTPRMPAHRPATGQAHLHFAAGCQVGKRGCDCAQAAVRDAEAQLAKWLIRHGEKPVFDADGFVDIGAQINAYETWAATIARDVAHVWRECARVIRIKTALKETAA